MGLFDFLKKKELQEIIELKASLKKYQPIIDIEKEEQKIKLNIDSQKNDLSILKDKYNKALETYTSLVKEISLFEDKKDFIDVGVFEPIYNLDASEKYKERSKELIELRKKLISEDRAIISTTNWTVNGSEKEGRKMTNSYKKLFLRAFNGECDAMISKVKWNNVNIYGERIIKLYETLNKLGENFAIEISKNYLDVRLLELNTEYSYQLKKQQEKEEMQEIKERLREEEKAIRDYEKAQKEAEKEEKNFAKALELARKELNDTSKEKQAELLSKISILEEELKLALEKKERALSMAQQTKRGYVYIISNIGSFGDNIHKIGLTRRLEPMDRVKELGDASVPFQFDVHALIFSEDAPALENFLHKEFAEKKVNMLNNRKEFFNVSIEDIELKLKELNLEVELIKIPEAMEYRETLAILERINSTEDHKSIEELIEEKFPKEIF
ncbi:DUF4041 domain-containing protein [Myroides odoratimimus]|uniref:DUF4041 domain-containing protein n=1 Tax=Myroides odoratimimus TaxID=76832 RepID=UPI002577CC01|nr:DUF4041 domain-containing protein [Myroides odoratimimus]MDM1415772.1 DUF4041 domain-containing protein [Myroides odoratimimus]MDM1448401.1 DUF4041 domain-containing protein [Myroides odoratimimus]MEC4009283.1 DUF4041 domain-containing protein [Myroides odoratimimus]